MLSRTVDFPRISTNELLDRATLIGYGLSSSLEGLELCNGGAVPST